MQYKAALAVPVDTGGPHVEKQNPCVNEKVPSARLYTVLSMLASFFQDLGPGLGPRPQWPNPIALGPGPRPGPGPPGPSPGSRSDLAPGNDWTPLTCLPLVPGPVIHVGIYVYIYRALHAS